MESRFKVNFIVNLYRTQRASEGRRLPYECVGWKVSFAMLMALQVRRVVNMSVMEGRGAPMIILAVFTMHSSDFRYVSVLPPCHTVMQPVTLTMVPW